MFILASNSPRRKELMHEICSSFLVVPADVDEKKLSVPSPLDSVHIIARAKGEKIHKEYPNDIVISADTIVVYNNQLIGKPKSEEKAYQTLTLLSDKTHEVITSYCIFYKDKLIQKEVISFVTMNPLSKSLIQDYIATKSPLDKAGAYGVQDNDKFPIVKSVKGSIKNVIGFPTDEIIESLKELKLL